MIEKLIASLRAFGTEQTLFNIVSEMDGEEERRFWRAYNVYFTRALENTRLSDKSGSDGVIKRGTIAELIKRSCEYAFKDSPEYRCDACHSECGVVNLTTDTAYLKCRKCGQEFRKKLKT